MGGDALHELECGCILILTLRRHAISNLRLGKAKIQV